MWFDPHAKLTEITGQPPATAEATATQPQAGRPVSQLSQAPEAGNQAPRVAVVASVATPSHSKPDPAAPWASKGRRLPTTPKTCAVCGKSDWLVTMTERDGRTVHVGCSTLAGAAAKRVEP
jgi:hypothetical protein